MKHKFDISKSDCHVCGRPLNRLFENEIEWCDNDKCQVYEVGFSIPYRIPKKLVASEKAILK